MFSNRCHSRYARTSWMIGRAIKHAKPTIAVSMNNERKRNWRGIILP